MDETVVKDRINGRKMAHELFALIDGSTETRPYMESLLYEFSKLAGLNKDKAEEAVEPVPLQRLAATVMPFGLHAGKTFDEVPIEYLDWLCRSQEDFYEDLRAYLTHPDVRVRYEREDVEL